MKNKQGYKKIWKYIIVMLLGLILLLGFSIYSDSIIKDMKYETFMKNVEEEKVESVSFYDSDNTLLVTMKEGDYFYRVYNPKTDDFRETLILHEVDIQQPFRINFVSLAPFLSILLLGFFILKMMGGKIGPSISMSEHKVDANGNGKITFNNIACNSDIKKEMLRLVDYLERPKFYEEKHAKFPNGILLYGPPGTGKTMMAKAIAAEAKCAFYSLAGSDFVEMYVGRGASRVRELFKEAKKNAPAIIFIDEIDAIGGKRGHDNNSEKDQTINALLNELDGFNARDNIMVIAATNRLEDMDPALIRSGRFGKHIKVPLPQTAEERMKIINIHKVDNAYDETVNFESFAKLTRGLSGADISAILNDALLISIADGKEKVDKISLDKAFNQHLLEGHSDNKKGIMKLDEQRLVAYHEAGHAVVGRLRCGETVSTISIIGTTSGAGGYTISSPEEERFFETKESLENRLMMMYGGRAAEKIMGYPNSVGAANDIERATAMLDAMYNEYAIMQDDIPVNFNVLTKQKNKDNVDEIARHAKELFNATKAYLILHQELLTTIAETLLNEETIDETRFEEIVQEYLSKNNLAEDGNKKEDTKEEK